MKKIITAIVCTALLLTGAIVHASGVDIGFGKDYFSGSVDVSLADSNFTFVLHTVGNIKSKVIDQEGNLTLPGHFKITKTGKSYSEFGLGYRVKDFVSFISFGTYNTSYHEEQIITKDGKPILDSNNKNDTTSGLSCGIRYDKRIENVGILGSIAKVPDGWYWFAKARYYFPVASIHAGYVGQKGIDNKVFAGFGIAY